MTKKIKQIKSLHNQCRTYQDLKGKFVVLWYAYNAAAGCTSKEFDTCGEALDWAVQRFQTVLTGCAFGQQIG